MTTVYWQDEKPPEVQEFVSMHPLLAERKGLLLHLAGQYHDSDLVIVLDDVCAENTIYAGAPFVGPRTPEVTT